MIAVDGQGLSVMLMKGLITFILNLNHKIQVNFKHSKHQIYFSYNSILQKL